MSQFFVTSTGGSGGSGILTINDISPDVDGNFTLQPLNGIALAAITNGVSIQNTEGVSRFVVDSGGNAGYTTIQAAINAAAALTPSAANPQTVWIWPGTYTENLTISPFVNLSSAAATGVIINGNASYTSASDGETFTANHITFQSTTATSTFIIAGTNQCVVNFNNCIFNIDSSSSVSCLQVTNSNGATNVFQTSCLSKSSDNASIYTFTSGSQSNLFVYSCLNTSNAQSTFAGNTFIQFYCSFLIDSYQITASGAELFCNGCILQNLGSNAIFQISSGSFVEATNNQISCSATYWANGLGTLYYGSNILAGGNSGIDPGLTIGSTFCQFPSISFDAGSTQLDTVTQGTIHQVLLGTGTSAVSVVSGTGTSGQVLTSNGTGADPNWQAASSSTRTIVNITDADSPYTVDYTFNYIACDTTGGAITINFPDTGPSTASIVVKDSGGDSTTNNITYTTAGGTTLFDGLTSRPIDDNYNSVEIIWNTDHYEAF